VDSLCEVGPKVIGHQADLVAFLPFSTPGTGKVIRRPESWMPVMNKWLHLPDCLLGGQIR